MQPCEDIKAFVSAAIDRHQKTVSLLVIANEQIRVADYSFLIRLLGFGSAEEYVVSFGRVGVHDVSG